MITAVQLLMQLSQLVLKHPDASIYVQADHGQTPERKGDAQLALVSEESYYLHDDIEIYYINDIDEDTIKSLEDEGYKYVIIIG